MKRLIIILIFSCCMLPLQAQLAVASFSENVTSQDAKTHYPKKDQDGRLCALVKISTTEKGFTFNCGSLPVVDVVYKPAEVWVYLPDGAMRIKITHEELGSLEGDNVRNGFYEFDSQLKSGHEYYMVLRSGKVKTTVEAPVVQTGWLILESNPSEADVYLVSNGVESLEGQTPFQKKLAYGNYDFRVKKNLYHDYTGKISINQPRQSQSATLHPAHGRMYITSSPSGAKVAIDGVKETYTTPCTTDVLPSGSYTVRLSKEKYAATQETVSVEDGKTATLNVSMSANFASITINTLAGAEIYLNGNKVATTTYSEELTPGIYDVEARFPSHRNAKRQIKVEANKSQTIQIDPTPIYGELDILSTPMEGNITIDGKTYGQTPITVSTLLVGVHTVTVGKEGYYPESRQVTIEEGKTATLNITLSNVPPCPSSAPTFKSNWEKAHNGDAGAMCSVGYAYGTGTSGVSKNEREAFGWYKKSAEGGDMYGMCNLGIYYYNGQGTDVDYEKAVEWYRKAADKGYSNAMNWLGSCYAEGHGVTKNYYMAVEWYRKAAEKGNCYGMRNLGLKYEYGEGVTQNYATAMEWYQKAKTAGYPDIDKDITRCQNKICPPCPSSDPTFKRNWEKAHNGDASAMNSIGVCYGKGTNGVNINENEAFKWYKKAAEGGNMYGMSNLAWEYYHGSGTEINYEKAVEWYRKAADLGSADAMNWLGNCYYNGYGVTKNYYTAVQWYRKAAEKGECYGMRNLGMCYEYGNGVTQNYYTALDWYQKAKTAGNTNVDKDITRCRGKM